MDKSNSNNNVFNDSILPLVLSTGAHFLDGGIGLRGVVYAIWNI